MAFDHGDLDQDTADRLLTGRVTPDDAPPGYGGVAQLLQRAHGDTALDVTDDELVVAMVNAIVAGEPARTERTHVLTRIVTTKVLVAGAVVALTATSAAAATGTLPAQAQNGIARAAQHIGINLPEAASDNARRKSDHVDPGGPAAPATEVTETKADGSAGEHGDARTSLDPAAAGTETSPPTTANHGAVVSETAHAADPSGGKGEEVSPVARDNHGAEVRAEKQSPTPTTAGGPGNSNGHANANVNAGNASDHANGKP